jgi:hypothetical protein
LFRSFAEGFPRASARECAQDKIHDLPGTVAMMVPEAPWLLILTAACAGWAR